MQHDHDQSAPHEQDDHNLADAPTAQADDDGNNQSPHDDLNAKIHALQEELDSAKGAYARANAEAYNAQKRAESEIDKAYKFAVQKFARDLLDTVDNFERALATVDGDSPFIDGIRLTHKTLVDALAKHGVVAIDPMGEKLDPNLHEAVGIDPTGEKDVISSVLQKGYTLNGRVLRPAMVRVGG